MWNISSQRLLTTIGEPLVPQLLMLAHENGGLQRVPVITPGCPEKHVKEHNLAAFLASTGDAPTVEARLRHPADKYKFDGQHKVDVLVPCVGGRSRPLEVKLGLTRLSSKAIGKWAPFDRDHSRKRFKGAMANVLENLSGLEAEIQPGVWRGVSSSWGLVARRAVIGRWRATSAWPCFRRCTMVAFEDLAGVVPPPARQEAVENCIASSDLWRHLLP